LPLLTPPLSRFDVNCCNDLAQLAPELRADQLKMFASSFPVPVLPFVFDFLSGLDE
jgi:hypothetical protein